MIKYMKYEIQGTYKFILGLILTVLVASTGLQIYGFNYMNRFYNDKIGTFPLEPLIVVILMLIIFGAFITSLFYIIGSFRKELYEDRGYLTFSLPLTGSKIVGSKLIVAFMWLIVIGLISLGYNLILGSLLFGDIVPYALREVSKFILSNKLYIIFGIPFILFNIMTLALVYFSITFSKVSVKNKKLGGLWFILFLVLNSIVGYLHTKFISLVPYFIDLTTLKVVGENRVFELLQKTFVITYSGLFINPNTGAFLHIGSTLFLIIAFIGIFLGTSYLIENKIDL